MSKEQWKAQAYAALVRFAKRARKPFTIERARSAIGQRIDQPKELRWWGSVTQTAIKQGVIKPCGWARARSSHGSPKPEYRVR